MCESLMGCESIFIKYFLNDFSELQRDRIINVRMTLAESIANHCKSRIDGPSDEGSLIIYHPTI